MIRIREIPSWNFGPKTTDITNTVLSFPTLIQTNIGINLKYAMTCLLQIFSIVFHSQTATGCHVTVI
jgi:hypothetical protein